MGESSVDPLVWQHAQDGLNLVEDQYRFQYTCRFQPVSQLFAILHLSEVLIRAFPEIDQEFGKDGIASIKLATEILAESHKSFPIAGVFMAMLQETARRFLSRFPNALEDAFRLRRRNSKYHLDDAINACGGPTYVQPLEAIQRRFSPDMQSQWILHAASGHLRLPHETSTLQQPSLEETGAQNLMRILNLHNTK